MLLQSHNGVLRVFPAIPSGWEDVSFTTLRAEGAALVSAERRNGRTQAVKITCEKGGPVKLADPFGGAKVTQRKNNIDNIRFKSGFIEFLANPGDVLELSLDKSCN